MIDVKKEIYQKLNEIKEAKVVYFFPDEFNELPIISYYEIENSDSGYCGREVLSDISYQIDVWGRGNISKLCIEVDKKMAELGFRRSFGQDLSKDGIARRTLRYSARINNKTGYVYKK